MCHVSRSLNFHSGAFTVIFFALIHSCRGQSQVVGPSQPIMAMVGDDVVLPCHLAPVMDASGLTVEWARPDLDPRFVLVWRDGVELKSKKHPTYEGRTSLFMSELKLGNVSLKLSKVKLSDEGSYRCFIPRLVGNPIVQVVVGATSSPVIQMSRNISGVDLLCTSEGWYPEPEVLWLDSEGNLLSAGPPETVRGPDDLYTVSSRVTMEKRHSNRFTCRVQQQYINQTREAHIHVPDDFFPDPPSSSSSATIAGLVVVGVILVILSVVFGVWKLRRNKIRNKKHHEDEEMQKVREEMKSFTGNHPEQESPDLDKEKETLKTKNREEKEWERKVSRLEGQMKDKEEQIKKVKEQLEEVDRQREETLRKIHSVNMEEDEDTMKDLEKKKTELQKQLQKFETTLEVMKKQKNIMIERKNKATKDRGQTGLTNIKIDKSGVKLLTT